MNELRRNKLVFTTHVNNEDRCRSFLGNTAHF